MRIATSTPDWLQKNSAWTAALPGQILLAKSLSWKAKKESFCAICCRSVLGSITRWASHFINISNRLWAINFQRYCGCRQISRNILIWVYSFPWESLLMKKLPKHKMILLGPMSNELDGKCAVTFYLYLCSIKLTTKLPNKNRKFLCHSSSKWKIAQTK